MPDDTGLPPPPIPQPRPAPIQRAPDLESVNQGLSQILNSTGATLGRMALGSHGDPSSRPEFRPFSSGGTGALTQVKSALEKTMDSSVPGLSFVSQALASPITSGVDEYQAAKIRDLQSKFFAQHGDQLREMSRAIGDAVGGMTQLGRLLDKQGGLRSNDIQGIMQQKSALGNSLSFQIEDALGSAQDPDDRAKLEAMKNDFQNWQKDRDARVKKEWPQVSSLQGCIDKMNAEIYRQRRDMLQAADQITSQGHKGMPYLMRSADGGILESTLQTPEACRYIRNLRESLLASRAQFTGIISSSRR